MFHRLEKYLADEAIDGAALAVGHGGELVGEWYGGLAAPGVDAAPDTLWPLACVSKTYTAATVMALVEQGELTLSMPVRSHLPEFERDGLADVRLRQLLTHTAGLRRATPARFEELLRARAPLSEHLADAGTEPPLFPPGTAFNYTDYGYALAARLAEAVTGTSFADLMRTTLLKPADLADTHFPPAPDVDHRIARVAGVPAADTDGAFLNSAYFRRLEYPSFGVYAGVRDLLRFGLLFGSRPPARVLSAASVRCMTTDQTGGQAVGHVMPIYPAQHRPWGLGWSVRGALGNGFEDLASPESVMHVGAAGMILLVDPRADVTIAFSSNRHVSSGTENFVQRLSAVAGMVLAALT
ncbi:serine hydrolase domain-containing protein [Actinophytocola sp.]|uniref:serine hydrolase domain-containing protein n=1 Tax=Actinophytocola sp. TaxID=1872138 RepID=UPI003D6B190F